MRNRMLLKLLKTDLIAFDPGETTGVVEIKQGKLIKACHKIKHENCLSVAFGGARSNPTMASELQGSWVDAGSFVSILGLW